MSDREEKKNKRIAAIVSGGIHVLILVLFIFLLAWKEPNPPLPEYGIELNFGLDEAGSGDVQTEQPPVVSETEEEPAPEEEVVEEPAEVQEEVTEDPVEEVVENTPQEVVTQQESPDVVAPTPETKPEPEPVKQDPEPEEKRVEEPVKETPRPITQYKKSGNEGESDSEANTSQGDKSDAEGDQGDPEGSLDSRALYGNQGGGGGFAFSLSGWKLAADPQINDTSNEEGRIVFEIQVDDRGEIIAVRVKERTVSPEVARKYQNAVEQLSFISTSANTPPPVSRGTITFNIEAK